jgi:hypothetical protein
MMISIMLAATPGISRPLGNQAGVVPPAASRRAIHTASMPANSMPMAAHASEVATSSIRGRGGDGAGGNARLIRLPSRRA